MNEDREERRTVRWKGEGGLFYSYSCLGPAGGRSGIIGVVRFGVVIGIIVNNVRGFRSGRVRIRANHPGSF